MSLQGFSGAAGIKYGLNLRGVKKPVAPGRGLFCAAQEDDDEGDAEEDRAQSDAARANIQIARQQAQQRESQKVGLAAVASACGTDSNSVPQVHELYASALAEDATVFDYDGVYDQMKASTQKQPVRGGWETGPDACSVSDTPPPHAPQAASTAQAPPAAPKYIGQLLTAAKAREREQEVVFERRQVKERQKEDHLFGDKDKFVTAAYKAKLAEDAKWLAEEQAKEAKEAAADVTKRRDLSGFYANLMTRNAAFGGAAPAEEAPPGGGAAPSQQQQQAHPVDEDRAAAAAAPSEDGRGAGGVGLRGAHTTPADDPSGGGREPEEGQLGTVSAGPVEPPVDALADAARAAAQGAAAALLPSASASRVKASDEAEALARERYLARKRARVDEPT